MSAPLALKVGDLVEGLAFELKGSIDVWLSLYQAARKHLVDVCETAISCGIEERKVRLTEQHATAIVNLIRGTLDAPEMGMTAVQQALGRKIAAGHLRALSGGLEGA